MESLAILSFVLYCVTSVASQSQTVVADCGPLFEICDNVFEASLKDMVQVDDYYQCLKRPHSCTFVQDEERDRRIVKLKLYVANVCPSCRLGERVWATPTGSADEMPEETCENQIFTCTTHKSDSMTRFDNLHEMFVCVQRPTECSEHEEYLRQAVANSIVNEMALVCPYCLVPNLMRPMGMGNMMDPEDLSCTSAMTLCNAKYNVKETNYGSFESLYMCIGKISNCEGEMENTLHQQQMEVLAMTMKRICPNCTMPTPAPPAKHMCLESLYHCSTYGIDEMSTSRHNALRKVHDCAMKLDECQSASENNMRFHLVHHVRMELAMECAHCDMPDVPDHLMDSIANAMPPVFDCCRRAVTSCQAIFNIRPRHQWRRYEEMYQCLQRNENCTPDDMKLMGQMTDESEQPLHREKRSASTSVKSVLAFEKKGMRVSTCDNDVTDCQQEFQHSPGNCGNRFRYLTCLTTMTNCQKWEEQLRMPYIVELFAIIQKECILMDDYSTYGGEWYSCFPVFLDCSVQFYNSNTDQRKAEHFQHCLRQPKDCFDWEEPHRQRMLQTALKYIDLSTSESSSE